MKERTLLKTLVVVIALLIINIMLLLALLFYKVRQRNTRERTEARIEFVEANARTFKVMDVLYNPISHATHKTKAAREIVNAARRELRYSDATASCDIFWTLYCQYKELSK